MTATQDVLKPLIWLSGKWKSIKAEGGYPSIDSFRYNEELEFTSIGQPMFIYKSNTYNPDSNKPMHLETGFLRIKPGSNEVALIIAHNFGLTTIEEGLVENEQMKVKTTSINRISFTKNPIVTEVTRWFRLNEKKQLEVTVYMATSNTPLTEHLYIVYEKC